MARRRSGLQPVHLAGAAAFLALAGGAYWLFARDKGEKLAGNPFSATQYQQNYTGMRGNKYVVTGTITGQLKYSPVDNARLFSMDVKEDGAGDPLPVAVLVPSKFSTTSIQIGQEFQMTVLVDKEGTLRAEDIRKS